jgi:hypothetical protein
VWWADSSSGRLAAGFMADGMGREETGREEWGREIDTEMLGAWDGRHVSNRTDGIERGAGGEGVSATRHPCRATNGGCLARAPEACGAPRF